MTSFESGMVLILNLIIFLKKINECHPSIKFEYEISKTEISFLDTTVFNIDITNYKLKCMSHQPSDKVIYTANQNILTPIKKYCL